MEAWGEREKVETCREEEVESEKGNGGLYRTKKNT